MKSVFIGADDKTANLAQVSVRIRWPDAVSLVAGTAQGGIEAAGEFSPDLVLLNPPFTDMSLPEAIEGIRRFSHVPLMIIGRSENPMEVVAALEVGADDYVRVPFDIGELTARIGAKMRRVVIEYDRENLVRSGTLVVNPGTFELSLDNRPLSLTSTEWKLLHILMKNHGIVVTHEALERSIWREEVESAQLVKKYVQRLRQKIGDTAEAPVWIASVRGVGYRFIGLYQGQPPSIRRQLRV